MPATLRSHGIRFALLPLVRIAFCCLVVMVALGGCGHQPPDQKLIHDLGPATSWIATLDLAAESWLGNRVPAAFMNDTIAAAQKALEQARLSVDESKGSGSLRLRVSEPLRVAADAAAALHGAVQRSDRMAVTRARARLAGSYAALHAIEQQEQR